MAYFCAVYDQTEMFWLDKLSAGDKAVIHGGLQTDLVATTGCRNTCLYRVFGGETGWMLHEIS
jgi:hypothetical protein